MQVQVLEKTPLVMRECSRFYKYRLLFELFKRFIPSFTKGRTSIKISRQIDHFYNKSAGSETGSSFFADIKLSYKTDRGNVEFLINNMLNNNEYTHISFNELTKSETQIFIRPRHFMILYTLQI